jgi:hypothetical protein
MIEKIATQHPGSILVLIKIDTTCWKRFKSRRVTYATFDRGYVPGSVFHQQLLTSAATHRPLRGSLYRSKKGKRETKLVAGVTDRDGDTTVVEVVGFLSRRRRKKKKSKSRSVGGGKGKKIHGLTGEKEERPVAVLAG